MATRTLVSYSQWTERMESNGDRWKDVNEKMVNGGHPEVFIGHNRASVLNSPSATARCVGDGCTPMGRESLWGSCQ
jgi:hypothetical protein